MAGYCYVRNPSSARQEAYHHSVSGAAIGKGHHADTALASLSGQGDATVPAHSGVTPRDDATFFADMRGFTSMTMKT